MWLTLNRSSVLEANEGKFPDWWLPAVSLWPQFVLHPDCGFSQEHLRTSDASSSTASCRKHSVFGWVSCYCYLPLSCGTTLEDVYDLWLFLLLFVSSEQNRRHVEGWTQSGQVLLWFWSSSRSPSLLMNIYLTCHRKKCSQRFLEVPTGDQMKRTGKLNAVKQN